MGVAHPVQGYFHEQVAKLRTEAAAARREGRAEGERRMQQKLDAAVATSDARVRDLFNNWTLAELDRQLVALRAERDILKARVRARSISVG